MLKLLRPDKILLRFESARETETDYKEFVKLQFQYPQRALIVFRKAIAGSAVKAFTLRQHLNKFVREAMKMFIKWKFPEEAFYSLEN